MLYLMSVPWIVFLLFLPVTPTPPPPSSPKRAPHVPLPCLSSPVLFKFLSDGGFIFSHLGVASSFPLLQQFPRPPGFPPPVLAGRFYPSRALLLGAANATFVVCPFFTSILFRSGSVYIFFPSRSSKRLLKLEPLFFCLCRPSPPSSIVSIVPTPCPGWNLSFDFLRDL